MSKFGDMLQDAFGSGDTENPNDFLSSERLNNLKNMEWNIFKKEFWNQFSTLKKEVLANPTPPPTTTETESVATTSTEDFLESMYATTFDFDSVDEDDIRKIVEKSSIYIRGSGVSLLKNDQYTNYLHTLESKYELPQFFLKEVMNQESGGYVYDYDGKSIIGSSAGAQGPFQFMPATAAEYASKLGCSTDQIYADPYWSAQAAAKMYGDIGFVDGSFHVATALASYNRGIGNVSRKLDGKVTTHNFHLLPAETKDYITKITGAWIVITYIRVMMSSLLIHIMHSGT